MVESLLLLISISLSVSLLFSAIFRNISLIRQCCLPVLVCILSFFFFLRLLRLWLIRQCQSAWACSSNASPQTSAGVLFKALWICGRNRFDSFSLLTPLSYFSCLLFDAKKYIRPFPKKFCYNANISKMFTWFAEWLKLEHFLIASAEEVMFVGWLVCQRDYTKTTQRISTKLGWGMGHGPE